MGNGHRGNDLHPQHSALLCNAKTIWWESKAIRHRMSNDAVHRTRLAVFSRMRRHVHVWLNTHWSKYTAKSKNNPKLIPNVWSSKFFKHLLMNQRSFYKTGTTGMLVSQADQVEIGAWVKEPRRCTFGRAPPTAKVQSISLAKIFILYMQSCSTVHFYSSVVFVCILKH